MNFKSAAACEFGAVPVVEFKTVGENGAIEGYASVFGEVDLARDIVMPGAFTASLKARGASKVKMFFMHNQSDPVGVWTDIAEDSKGLHAKGRVLIETARGKDVHEQVKAGALDGLSIGYRTIKSRHDVSKKARLLDQLDLWEISLATIPLLDSARVTSVKNFDSRELEGALRDAGLSRSAAVTAVGIFRKSLQSDSGEPEEGQREAASDLLATMRRFKEKLGA